MKEIILKDLVFHDYIIFEDLVLENEIEIKDLETDILKIKPQLEDLEITPTKEEQIFNHPNSDGYDELIVNKIPNEYIIPEGTKEITSNGNYDVTEFASAIVSTPTPKEEQSKSVVITENGTTTVRPDTNKVLSSVEITTDIETGSPYPIIEGTGKHEVRFIDYDGTILKIQYVNDGGSATAPQTPEHDRLTFVEWNRDYSNITHDLDVGALYTTVSGNTELFIDVTEETGLQISLNLYKGTATGTVTIDWGDGSTTNARVTTSRSVTHTYTDYGEYMISIIGDFGYGLGGASAAKPLLKGANEVTSYNLLKKCYCSSGATVLKNYCFFNNFNLEEFTSAHLVEIWQYIFYGTKQKTLFVPPNVSVINLYIISNCTSLKYFILPTNVTNISYPAFRGSYLEKMIFPENYELTTYTYGVFYNATKYFWYKKPSTEYILSSNFAVGCIFLEKVPIYDNLTGVKSYNNFSYCNIKKIAFPPSLKEMDNGVFISCNNLTDVYMYAHTPPTLAGTSIFTGNSNLKIHVYPEDLETYQTATNWSTTAIKNKLVGDLEGEFKDGYCE